VIGDKSIPSRNIWAEIKVLLLCTVHLIQLVMVIESEILRLTGHVARMEEGRSALKFYQLKF
jgi:hypothetical protein